MRQKWGKDERKNPTTHTGRIRYNQTDYLTAKLFLYTGCFLIFLRNILIFLIDLRFALALVLAQGFSEKSVPDVFSQFLM
jgi:hypothetical protein